MKTKIGQIPGIVFLLVLAACGGESGTPAVKKKNGRQEMNVQGKVKTVMDLHQSAMASHIILKKYTLFDEAGNIIEKGDYTRFFATDPFKKRIHEIYKYDAEGKLIEKIDCKNSDVDYTKTLYDEKERSVEVQHFTTSDYSDKEMFSKAFRMRDSRKTTYEDKGKNKVEEYVDGEIKTGYTYDRMGNVISRTNYRNGKLYSINDYEYEYDKKGNIIKEIEYHPYKPDSDNKYNQRYGAKDETIRKYDENNNLISSKTYKYEWEGRDKPKLVSRQTFNFEATYDPYGNRTDLYTNYEYDDFGNWIKREENSSQKRVYQREYEYYK